MPSEVEPDAGGETALPLATALDEDLQSIDSGYSECASRQGISVRPRKVGSRAGFALSGRTRWLQG